MLVNKSYIKLIEKFCYRFIFNFCTCEFDSEGGEVTVGAGLPN